MDLGLIHHIRRSLIYTDAEPLAFLYVPYESDTAIRLVDQPQSIITLDIIEVTADNNTSLPVTSRRFSLFLFRPADRDSTAG